MGAKRKSQATYTGGVATTSYELVLESGSRIHTTLSHAPTDDR